MADEDDVPPLEDMSELLAQVEALRERKSKGVTSNGSLHSSDHNSHIHEPLENQKLSSSSSSQPSISTSTTSASSTSSAKSSTKSSSSGTGMFGFKKGFLLGNTESKSKQQKSSQVKSDTKDNVPFIKKKEETGENLKIPEVQKMMSDAEKLTKDTDAWVTDDLLKKIEENEDLFKKMGERKYMEAIHFFQKNPTEAMERYKHDVEVQEFFKKFMGIMGEHFSSLGDKTGQKQQPQKQSESKIVEIDESEAHSERVKAKHPRQEPAKSNIQTRSSTDGADMSVRSSTNPNQPTAEDERRMQDILSNPEIRNILMDQKVFGLIEALRSNPSEGQRMFATADSETKGKIQKLVQCGILQFQT